MRSALESTLTTTSSKSARSLILLAPAGSSALTGFVKSNWNKRRYEDLMSRVQRFRGAAYLSDGALRPDDLDGDGRHRVESDYRSWHLIAVNENEEVCGCSRYRIHSRRAEFDDLAVSRSPLAQSENWRDRLYAAVELQRELAHRRGIDFVEVGGWAIAEDLRWTMEAIRIALGTYALASHLGGCIGITTATLRHQSANVLRKIGGMSLDHEDVEIPRYFDPEYNCEMQVLRFDSAAPNRRLIPWIEQLRSEILRVEVVLRDVPVRATARPRSADVLCALNRTSGTAISRMSKFRTPARFAAFPTGSQRVAQWDINSDCFPIGKVAKRSSRVIN
jgi:hypothetical protein